ncbi:MAG: response regulator [Flavisolibacter sp.]
MKKLRIILVENDEDEQVFMMEGFERSGMFDILKMANSGNELFEWMADNPSNLPEIILSDLNMSGKNGYDIISEVKSNPAYSHIPVIITSTSSTNSIINKCISLGASEYLVKPETFINYHSFAKKLYDKLIEKKLVHL